MNLEFFRTIAGQLVLLGACLLVFAGLGLVIYLEVRARRPQQYRSGISRGVHARLFSVIRHRMSKLQTLPPEELRRLPERQFEKRVSYNGRKFSLTTLRSQSPDGTMTITVVARSQRMLIFPTRVSDSFVVPLAEDRTRKPA